MSRPQDIPIFLGAEPTEDKPKATPTNDLGKIQAKAPGFISEHDLQKLLDYGAPKSLADGVTVVGDTSKVVDTSDIPLRFTCHCLKFDLSSDEDRVKYAELFGKSGDTCSNINITWEKQVVFEDRLIVYVTYTEALRVVDG